MSSADYILLVFYLTIGHLIEDIDSIGIRIRIEIQN